MKTNVLGTKIALTAAILTASAAQAELITYDLEWSGLRFQNEATATGQVTIDTDLVPNPGHYDFGPWEGSPFSNFSITITGAISGNGTFSTANNDFASVVWTVGEFGTDLGDVVEPIDLYSELMGQDGFNDFNVFNAFDDRNVGGNPGAPTGFEPFILQTGQFVPAAGGPGPNRDLIELVSMRPVPAPSSMALIGLGALATTRRRR